MTRIALILKKDENPGQVCAWATIPDLFKRAVYQHAHIKGDGSLGSGYRHDSNAAILAVDAAPAPDRCDAACRDHFFKEEEVRRELPGFLEFSEGFPGYERSLSYVLAAWLLGYREDHFCFGEGVPLRNDLPPTVIVEDLRNACVMSLTSLNRPDQYEGHVGWNPASPIPRAPYIIRDEIIRSA